MKLPDDRNNPARRAQGPREDTQLLYLTRWLAYVQSRRAEPARSLLAGARRAATPGAAWPGTARTSSGLSLTASAHELLAARALLAAAGCSLRCGERSAERLLPTAVVVGQAAAVLALALSHANVPPHNIHSHNPAPCTRSISRSRYSLCIAPLHAEYLYLHTPYGPVLALPLSVSLLPVFARHAPGVRCEG